ncbi:MAG: peptide-methionine (R)-S-oxide reductase MsrB [Thaumarchaeota archaeon]|nr:peptide-methionine (R)-S-oxide reductase MsrB [Nitrososphaerota archaeon]
MVSEKFTKNLTSEQHEVCVRKGTEAPFTGKYFDSKDDGIYQCALCSTDLFSSETKYDSGTGWPSFWRPIGDNVDEDQDDGVGMQRTEVLCKNCGSHLGHVFSDGPPPTNLRYCINSVSLKLVENRDKV